MRVVVTGGAGFIGSNLVEVLSGDNEVIVVDDLSTGDIRNIQCVEGDVTFVRGSVTDLNLLMRVFEDVDYVFHLAAIASVPGSIRDPITYNNVNVKGTLNVLMAARDCGVEKVVYASSSAVYGNTPELPKREDMLPDPLSPYAVTKLVGEYYCNVFNEVYGLKTVSLRYFNVYGPRQNPHSEYAAVIPKFIKRVLSGKPPVIYGDGEQTRDFIFVKDVVNATILAAKSNAEGVYNIATGRKTSINDLAHMIMKLIDSNNPLKPVYDAPRAGDVRHSFGDISKARRDMGYEPRYSLEEGLMETISAWRTDESMR